MTLELRKHLEKEVEVLKQARDELRVQLHLGAADAQDVWDALEKKWEHLEGRLKRIGQTTQESSEDVEQAAKNLLSEIKSGYNRIRESI